MTRYDFILGKRFVDHRPYDVRAREELMAEEDRRIFEMPLVSSTSSTVIEGPSRFILATRT